MLYVFHVDAGQMTTYDMNLTLQSVSCLKAAIERKTKIAASSLVLLVSGGEVLQSDHMVSSYSAGTDTNPIYMFNKPSEKESHLKQSMYSDLSPIVELSSGEFRSDTRSGVEGKSLAELKANVDTCCAQQPTVNTVIKCATLAQQFSDLAHDVSKSCDQLVHEQHLQHQGWSAVVANLEDIFNEFCERSRNFKESFRKHRLKKDEYREQLTALNEVLESLGKIPILPALQLNAEAHRFSAFDVFEETDFEGQYYRISEPLDGSEKTNQDFGVEAFKLSEEEDVFGHKDASTSKDAEQPAPAPVVAIEESDEGVTFKAHSYENKEEPTLLHWILAQGNKASLQDILDYCQKGLALIDAEPLKELEEELCNVLEYANMHGLKQIKGIEDRLYRLDQLLNDVKKLERDQHDQAASLIQYRERLNAACDPSVLPTLVQSHWCQLEKLLKGHHTLVEIRRRISKSKDELSHILKARLKAVLMIENSMSVQDAHAMLSFQCFNRLARYFDIVGQLHRAPAVYVRAVHEVARRRTFSQAHLKWATDLAAKLIKIHDEEIIRRQDFNCLFEGHFLKSLFPGMTELPPAFATQSPPAFDARLPQVTDEDVELIANAFPQFAKDVPSYDMEMTVKFFQQRISSSDHQERDIDVQVDFEKDFESETDAGDFERLSRQSTSQKQRVDTSTICVPDTMAVSTVTEDNMDTHKINMERLQDFLLKLYSLCRVNIVLIREELARFKDEMDEQKKFIRVKYLEILEAWQKSSEENALKFREQTQRLTVDHELELSDMKAALDSKDDTIESLKNEKEELKTLHHKDIERLELEHNSTKELLEKTREEIKLFEKKLEEAEVQKQKELKDSQEKMHLEYKAEIESLRSRYRLVALTNMDRSPSESSLEKIERSDVIEITSHNAIVMQTQENAEVEKEQAVAKVQAELTQKYTEEINALKAKYEAEKQVTINDVTRRLLSEKDRQLDELREREHLLSRECSKYRDTIRQLTDPETNDCDPLLATQATINDVTRLLSEKDRQLDELREREHLLSRECSKYRDTIRQLTDPETNDCDPLLATEVTINDVTRLLSEKDRQLDELREREHLLSRECSKYRDTIRQLTDPETNDCDPLLATQVTINDVTRRLLSEKDRQLDELREREHLLSRECSKYRDTIRQLTDPETNDCDPLLATQVTINDVTRRLLSEKDRQLDELREREHLLSRECSKYRDTIRQLTDPETNDCDPLLATQLATLENEKALLQQQVQDLKKELEKKAEEADKVKEEDSEGRSSSEAREGRRRGRCHTPFGLSAGTLSLSSCLPGHTVLVMWDPDHYNYTVMQEASIMYFVHSDCLPALELSIHVKHESDRRLYAVAVVDSKEYCYAKKSGNRYHMPRASRFYRVRVRPLRPPPPPPPCCDQRHKTDVMHRSALPVFGEGRPLKKWLTYMHAPDMSKSVDTSQSTSSNTDEASKEVATATLINLESPVSTSENTAPTGEDQLDSIEANDQWHTARMQASTTSALTDMECSVGVSGGEPLELSVGAGSVVARGTPAPVEELAEEAAP